MLKRGWLKRTPIKRIGPKAKAWKEFRDAKLETDKINSQRDEIVCEDWKIGLPRCGKASANPDLHHVEGRDAAPNSYFFDKKLVWLVRECHDEAHNPRQCTESEEPQDHLA